MPVEVIWLIKSSRVRSRCLWRQGSLESQIIRAGRARALSLIARESVSLDRSLHSFVIYTLWPPALSQPNWEQTEWLPVLISVRDSRSRNKYLLTDYQGLSYVAILLPSPSFYSFWWKVKNHVPLLLKPSTGCLLCLNKTQTFYYGPQIWQDLTLAYLHSLLLLLENVYSGMWQIRSHLRAFAPAVITDARLHSDHSAALMAGFLSSSGFCLDVTSSESSFLTPGISSKSVFLFLNNVE